QSQCHEGWKLLPAHYNDGGYSGGTLDRPAMRQLLADVTAGTVDLIVVYKVDRLTRSLSDFAKIVDQLDQKKVSFVSVTQSFNTTTSMGRLTLNMLLSFAQFEREVTGERIRDKIAASKKKGIWMGGPVPLGYQVIERKLIPVPEEAERVRRIMQRYLEVRTVPALIERLRSEGIITKVQFRTGTPHRGGIPFARGSLFHLLKNPVYRGKIVHKGQVYEGEHEAIVDEDLWEQVQMHLGERAPPRRRPKNSAQDALLGGLLSDPEGRQIVATYATKGTRRYSYYETRKDLARSGDPPSARFGQGELNAHIISHVSNLLDDEHGLRRMANLVEAERLRSLFAAARVLRAKVINPADAGSALRSFVALIQVQKDMFQLTLKPSGQGIADQPCWNWSIPRTVRKPFREAKLRIDAAGDRGQTDRQLAELIADAFEAQKLVLASPDLSLNQIAKRDGRCRKQLTKLFRVSWLSPRIVEAITSGSQPKRLTRNRMLELDLPVNWTEQELQLGFTA
ncbi:MAG: recombinase family protein, partial [Novosphingobium sp.]